MLRAMETKNGQTSTRSYDGQRFLVLRTAAALRASQGKMVTADEPAMVDEAMVHVRAHRQNWPIRSIVPR